MCDNELSCLQSIETIVIDNNTILQSHYDKVAHISSSVSSISDQSDILLNQVVHIKAFCYALGVFIALLSLLYVYNRFISSIWKGGYI